MKVNVINGTMDDAEVRGYMDYVRKKYADREIESLDITVDGEYVDLKCHFGDSDFRHVYRSADYLVKSIDKMNDAKKAEYFDKIANTV